MPRLVKKITIIIILVVSYLLSQTYKNNFSIIDISKNNVKLLNVKSHYQFFSSSDDMSLFLNMYILFSYSDKLLIYIPDFFGCEGNGCVLDKANVTGIIGLLELKSLKMKVLVRNANLMQISPFHIAQYFDSIGKIYYHYFRKYIYPCLKKYSPEIYERCCDVRTGYDHCCRKNDKSVYAKVAR